MNNWETWQWILFTVPNIITFLAYCYIPWRLMQPVEAVAEVDARDAFLFQAFIFSCAVHHLTHPLFMYVGWYWPMIAVDVTMAAVSTLAARYMKV